MQGGDTQGVIEAIKAGANVNAKDEYGYTAIILAVDGGHTEIVNALIKAGITGFGNAVIVAVHNGNAEIINALINAGADVNAKDGTGSTALMVVAVSGNAEIVNALIEAGADDLTDHNGLTALMYAAIDGNHDTVNALIDAGSNVTQKDNSGKTALDYARNNPRLNGLSALKRLEQFSKKARDDQQILDMCKNGDTQGVVEAIKAGANVNAKDNDGDTALMVAAQYGHTEIVNALIKAGADVNAKNNEYGATALMGAAANGYTEIVNALIDAGSYVKQKDNSGNTALDYAHTNPNLNGSSALKRLEQLSL